MPVITINYRPRAQQRACHDGMIAKRFAAVVTHRRFGKTVMGANHLIRGAMTCSLVRPRFAYIAPTFRMAKQACWDYLQHYSAAIPGQVANQSELRIDYPGGRQVRLFGADNPDSLRGMYFDGAILDEYGLMAPNTFSEVVRPCLSDRNGWAGFYGTPNGKNQFYDVVSQAKNNPEWFYAVYKASETGIIPAEELANARTMMTEDEYNQEYECSFEASIRGAIYAQELAKLERDGRMGRVPYDPVVPVDTAWDLGVGDATAIWFSQSLRSGEVRLIDYYEASGEGLPHYISVLKNKPYHYGSHIGPHDIRVREFSSGKSRIDVAAGLGLRFDVAPNLDLEEGIHAARLMLPKCYFDAEKCKAGIEALKHYRRDWNSRLNELKAVPVHDWCVTADTLVLTRYGTREIQYLPETGEVLTPCGWKPYQHPRVTRTNAPLVAVTFSDGHTVRCTPDHMFLTENGWTFACDLQTGSQIQSSLTRWRSISMAASIAFGRASAISRWAANACTELSGLVRLGLSRLAATFTIGMATTGAIAWPILSASRAQTIYRPDTIPPKLIRRDTCSPLTHAPNQRRGIRPKRAGFGIIAMRWKRAAGRNGSVSLSRVSAVVERCWRWCASLVTRRNTVARLAKPLRIERVCNLSESADVWCLTVPDGHWWSLANGAVVHNSEHGASAFRYLALTQRVKEQAAVTRRPVNRPTGDLAWMA